MANRKDASGYEEYRDRQAAISRERSAEGRDIGTLPKVRNPRRKARGRANLLDFLTSYFPNRFFWGFSSDHEEVIRREDRCTTAGGLFACAMPRGTGKTAITEPAALRALLYGFRKFIPTIQAIQRLSSTSILRIQRELESNDLLLEDFPEVCYPIRCLERISHRAKGQTYKGEPTLMQWTADKIVLPTIKGKASSGGVLMALPITGAVRGLAMPGPEGAILRPDMVLLDDPQDREVAKNPVLVAERESIVTDDVLGLAGPKTKIAAVMLCTVIYPGDLSDRFLSREKHPEWQGLRTKMLRAFPENMALWDQYSEIRRESFRSGGEGVQATEFYQANREAMDVGADASWELRMKDGEVSGVQSAMNLYLENPRGFRAEYQNDPDPIDGPATGKELLPAHIMGCLSGLPRFVAAREATRLTAFIDAGGGKGRGLWYAIVGWDNNFGGTVLDYGAFPRQGRSFFAADDMRPGLAELYPGLGETERLYAGLVELSGQILSRAYRREATGEDLRIERCIIDAGWKPETVYKFIRESSYAPLLYPSKGIGRSATSVGVAGWKRRPEDRYGHHWRLALTEVGKGRQVQFDTDEWKSAVFDRFTTAPGGRGRLTLFSMEADERTRADHEMLAAHCNAELATPFTLPTKGMSFDKWQKRPNDPDNHLWDCLVGCAVAASVQGLVWSPGGAAGAAEPVRQRVKLSEIQARKRQEREAGVR